MLLPQYDPWNKRKVTLYIIISMTIVGWFYGGFSYLFDESVPANIYQNYQGLLSTLSSKADISQTL